MQYVYVVKRCRFCTCIIIFVMVSLTVERRGNGHAGGADVAEYTLSYCSNHSPSLMDHVCEDDRCSQHPGSPAEGCEEETPMDRLEISHEKINGDLDLLCVLQYHV